jgi:hypothetical protein
MARINTYVTDADVQGTDKVLGTETGGATKNYTLKGIGDYFSQNNIITVAGQVVYRFAADTADYGRGTFMKTADGGGDGTALSSITQITVNKVLPNDVQDNGYLNKIFNSSIQIFSVNEINTFCNYEVMSIANSQDQANSFVVTLSGAEGQGNLTDLDYYAISSNEGGDKKYTHSQSSASAQWVINHNLNKKPSIAVVDSAGNNVIGEITYTNNNSITVDFSGSFAGYAYLN